MLNSRQRGYDRRWERARLHYLHDHPLCVQCDKLGKLSIATVVDHIKSHGGGADRALFWDVDNWQSLCKHCHDSYKQRLEKTGKTIGCDKHGTPLDAKHHWNQ